MNDLIFEKKKNSRYTPAPNMGYPSEAGCTGFGC